MKKPNITEGEWIEFSPYTNSSIYIKSEDQTIADIGFIENREANAKAIAQVPNLIDILIEVYESDIMDNGMTLIGDRTWNKMYEILGKAGCEL